MEDFEFDDLNPDGLTDEQIISIVESYKWELEDDDLELG